MGFTDKTGSKVPSVNFKMRQGHEWVEKNTDDLFKGKKVVLFALPGCLHTNLLFDSLTSL